MIGVGQPQHNDTVLGTSLKAFPAVRKYAGDKLGNRGKDKDLSRKPLGTYNVQRPSTTLAEEAQRRARRAEDEARRNQQRIVVADAGPGAM